jgi:hypothetical protein
MKSVRELFAYEIKDLKACLVEKHKIRTEDVPPIFSPPYRKLIKEREILKEEVSEMIRVGIIEESKSPWNSFIEKDVISNYWKNKGKFKKKRGRKPKSMPMAYCAIFSFMEYSQKK